MALPPRMWGFLLACAVALGGVALGSELQHETIQAPAPDVPLASESVASGNIILLTATLVATGVTIAAWLLLRTAGSPGWRAAGGAAALWFGTYGAVLLVQSAFANYFVCNQVGPPECHQAAMRIMLLAHNEPSAPSLLVAVWASFAGALLAAAWGASRLRAARTEPTLAGHFTRQGAAAALAVPFLAVAAAGLVEVTLDVPAGAKGAALHLVVLPLAALCCLALAALQALKLRHLGRAAANPRLLLAVEEAWSTLQRYETVTCSALGALLLAGAFLPALDVPSLAAPFTFRASLPSHHALLTFLAIPLAPAVLHSRRVARHLAAPLPAPHPEPALSRQGLVGAAVLAACVPAALVASFAAATPQPAWLVTLALGAAAGWHLAPTSRGLLPCLLAGACAWAIGNGTIADFRGVGDNFLRFQGNTGLSALWRVAGALAAGAALAGIAHHAATRPLARRAGLLALGFGAGLALVALVELPIAIWTDSSIQGTAIALGSQLGREELPVRIVAHLVALASAGGAATALARLLRPAWFQRNRPGLAAPLATPPVRPARA